MLGQNKPCEENTQNNAGKIADLYDQGRNPESYEINRSFVIITPTLNFLVLTIGIQLI
jgi:hypothetical protein